MTPEETQQTGEDGGSVHHTTLQHRCSNKRHALEHQSLDVSKTGDSKTDPVILKVSNRGGKGGEKEKNPALYLPLPYPRWFAKT